MFGWFENKNDSNPLRPSTRREVEQEEDSYEEENTITFTDGTVMVIRNGESCVNEDNQWYFEDVRIDDKKYDQLFIPAPLVKTLFCKRLNG